MIDLAGKRGLVIAEKPSLLGVIKDSYYTHKNELPYTLNGFVAQRGHLFTLLKPNELDESLKMWNWETLPIYPENFGGWKYKPIEEKKVGNFLTAKERIQAIKQEIESGNYDFIVNAGDPDQEGELLIRIVLAELNNTLPILRFWTNNIADENIFHALKNLEDDNNSPRLINLLSAAYGRQHADWLFGMNLSEAASLKMNGLVSVGRVKTVMLKIVVDREKEIENFTPKTVYGISANYLQGFDGSLFVASSGQKEDDENREDGVVWFDTKQEALDKVSTFSNSARVIEYKSEKKSTLPPKLFNLASVQVACGSLGYSAGDTQRYLQMLYEKKLLSYPRTSCEYIGSNENLEGLLNSVACIPSLAPFVASIDSSAIGRVRHTKKWCNDEKLEKEGHSGLVPTTHKPDMNSLSKPEREIYETICRQFVSIFMPNMEQKVTTVITSVLAQDGSENTFRSTGKKLLQRGWLDIFGKTTMDVEIPELSNGQILQISDYSFNEKTSTMPKRFSTAKLIEACENPNKFLNDKTLRDKDLTIGTPATRAPIIEELITRNKYMELTGKDIIKPTPVGKEIIENLKDFDICNVDMTAEWTRQLEAVRQGEMSLQHFEQVMKDTVAKLITEFKDSPMKPLSEGGFQRKSKLKILTKCPSCGGDILVGENGYFCSNWKSGCKAGSILEICSAKITEQDMLNLLSGKIIEKKMKNNGSVWTQKLRCDDSYKVEFVKAVYKKRGCPMCSQELKQEGGKLSCSCGFNMWMYVGGRRMTENELDQLFENGETEYLKNLKKKDGTSMSDAKVAFDYAQKTTKLAFKK